MGMRALPLSSSQNCCPPPLAGSTVAIFKAGVLQGWPSSRSSSSSSSSSSRRARVPMMRVECAKAAAADDDEAEGGEAEGKKEKRSKQSLIGSIADALDFSQVRSSKDAQLLDEARETTKAGEKMNRQQYGALRRKIGGTYKDFFKSYVDVDGEYVEEGWVDKTCKVCKKDTRGEPRQVDNLGRYAHVACIEKSKSANFFTKLFS